MPRRCFTLIFWQKPLGQIAESVVLDSSLTEDIHDQAATSGSI
jgi:hypothetical protein